MRGLWALGVFQLGGFFSPPEIVGSYTNRPLKTGHYRCTSCSITAFLAFPGRTVELSTA